MLSLTTLSCARPSATTPAVCCQRTARRSGTHRCISAMSGTTAASGRKWISCFGTRQSRYRQSRRRLPRREEEAGPAALVPRERHEPKIINHPSRGAKLGVRKERFMAEIKYIPVSKLWGHPDNRCSADRGNHKEVGRRKLPRHHRPPPSCGRKAGRSGRAPLRRGRDVGAGAAEYDAHGEYAAVRSDGL